MNKEELFKELKEKYRDYLYGKYSFSSVYKVEKELQSLPIQKESEIKEILAEIEKIEHEMKEEYDKEVVEPLSKELLEFLRFKGLIKGPAYYKRALELKEKLEKCDKNLKIRKKAALEFLISDKGFEFDKAIKTVDLLLELGALYMGSLWMYED